MDTLQRSLDLCAERLSRRVAPMHNTVDITGRDRDDYQQIFRLKAVEASIAFQKSQKPKSSSSEARWVFVALRNHAQTMKREMVRAPEMARYDLEPDAQLTTDMEARIVKRDLLKRIRKSIASREWDVLMQYAEADCNAREAWRKYGKGLTSRAYRYKVRKAKQAAQQVLKNLEKPLPIFA